MTDATPDAMIATTVVMTGTDATIATAAMIGVMTDATLGAMIEMTVTTGAMTGATLGAMIEMTATIAVMTGATLGAMTVTNATTGGTEVECGLTRKYRRRRRDCGSMMSAT